MKHIFYKDVMSLLCCVLFAQPMLSQNATTNLTPVSTKAEQAYLRILFYNAENYFDCQDDSLKQDDAFLPDGDYHWTPQRFWHKTHQLAKVLAVAGENRFPDIFALAEIETEDNLKALLKTASMTQYRYVYACSEDERGIDLCLAYHRYQLKLLDQKVTHLRFPQAPQKKTRPILYAKFLTLTQDSLHCFICHWPSKYGGALVTEPLRAEAARQLRLLVDSVFMQNAAAQILIIGDFNDTPSDASVSEVLRALPDTVNLKLRQCTSAVASESVNQSNACEHPLYNLMWTSSQKAGVKSHYYQGKWSMIDQVIVSEALFRKQAQAKVFQADFLLMDDENYLTKKPFRTYQGFKYLGGYSDHLPVFVDIPLKP